MEMEFSPFTLIAGVNASGKSNLFDALQLLSRLAEANNLKKAFAEQRGEFLELFTQYGINDYAKKMSFTLDMLVPKTVMDAWGSEAKLKYTRLRYELQISRTSNPNGFEELFVTHESLVNLKHNEDSWIKKINKNQREYWRPSVATGRRGVPYMETTLENGIPTVVVPQDGSGGGKKRFPLTNASRTVLSSFDSVDFPHLLAVKEEMKRWKFLQLNPEDLRKPSSKDGNDTISQSGQYLAAALQRIKRQDPYTLREISRKLNNFLPNFVDVDVIDDTENRQYLIKLQDVDGKYYSSRVLSEGTLRVLSLCILEHDPAHNGLLCFEEPENGIHPFRIEAMAELLKDLSTQLEQYDEPLRQVIVNTHSPLLLQIVHKWGPKQQLGIWLADIRKRVMDHEDKRVKIAATSFIPIHPDTDTHPPLFSEQEKKMTMATAQKILNTAAILN